MPHTLAQKILQAHTDEEVREAGQIVNCHLSGVLANDITGPLAIKSFRAMGAAKVFDKDRVFLVMDHFTPQKDIDSANQVMVTRKFAQEMDVTHYYEGGDCGVEHALLPEQGLVKPGDLVIGAPPTSPPVWRSAGCGSRCPRPSAWNLKARCPNGCAART